MRFSAGVAPLAVIGAGEGAATAPSGLELRPAHPGRWAWHSDQELRFVPARDWPLGQDFELRIDTRRALAAGTVLAADRHRFTTPGFTASVQSTEFHQDPTSAALKRGVFTLAFSHPVDPASLERRVALRMSDGAGRRLPAPGHQVRLDERGLVAWVQSEPLELPENGGTLALALGQGVASRLPGAGTAEGLQAEVALPALYSVELAQARLLLVDNAEHTPEQVLSLVFNHELRDTDVAGAVRAWLLPERREARAGETPPRGGWRVPYPWTAQEIDATLLEAAEPLALELLPPERDYSLGHSFRYQAPPGRRVWIEVERGLESFGGFRMGRPQAQVLSVPPYPRLLRFVGEGSLLSLRGERRISVVARNTPALRLEVGRVVPDQLHHFADTHSGRLSRPDLWQIGEDALVERFETRLRMPDDDPARPNYAGIDLSPFFDGSRRGVFLLSLREFDPAHMARPAERTLAENAGRETDRRLVVLTDLGVIAKRGIDGRQDVFVQSLSGRGPLAGARVAAIARNGSTLVSASTDARGHARLPSLEGFTRERAPVMLVVTLGEDMSFLPLDRRQRVLDTSRFDVGGEPNTLDGGQLRAVLFSDRGLYRPGETVHLGLILRAAEWSRSVEGLPMELVVTDPRGQVARRERVAFGAEGFEEARFTPAHDAASGPWQAALYLIEDRGRRRFVAATTVQVREFQPDTMRVRATLGTGEGGAGSTRRTSRPGSRSRTSSARRPPTAVSRRGCSCGRFCRPSPAGPASASTTPGVPARASPRTWRTPARMRRDRRGFRWGWSATRTRPTGWTCWCAPSNQAAGAAWPPGRRRWSATHGTWSAFAPPVGWTGSGAANAARSSWWRSGPTGARAHSTGCARCASSAASCRCSPAATTGCTATSRASAATNARCGRWRWPRGRRHWCSTPASPATGRWRSATGPMPCSTGSTGPSPARPTSPAAWNATPSWRSAWTGAATRPATSSRSRCARRGRAAD